MNLSPSSYAILKNFASINNSIFVDEPTVLKTMNNSGAIIAVYDAEEEFTDFAIYDLTELLNIISLFKLEDIDFDFADDGLTIKCGRNKIFYGYTDPDLIPHADKIKHSDKYKSFNQFDGSFDLSSKEIDKLQKASSIMGLKEMTVNVADGVCSISLIDDENPLTNKFNMEVDGDGEAEVKADVTNFQLITGDYKIQIANNKLIKFEHVDFPVIYFVAAMVSK